MDTVCQLRTEAFVYLVASEHGYIVVIYVEKKFNIAKNMNANQYFGTTNNKYRLLLPCTAAPTFTLTPEKTKKS